MRQYKDALDALRFTEEEQAMLIQKLTQAAQTTPKQKKRRHPRKVFCVAAAAACVLAFTAAAGAVVGFFADPDGGRTRLAEFFGGSAGDVETTTGFVASGASVTDHGVTISLDGMYADEQTVYAIFSAAKEDGTPFIDLQEYPNTDFLTFKGYEVRTEGEWNSCSGTPESASDMTQFFFQIEMDMNDIDQWQSKTARFIFSDIISYMQEGNYAGPDQTLVKGDWVIEVPLESTDTATYAQAGQVIPYGNLNVTIDSIAFTPAFYHLEWHFDKEMTFDDDMNLYLDGVPDEYDNEYYTEGGSPILTLKDGTTYDLWQIGHANSGLLAEVIPLEEMESITIFGQTIPLIWEK
ncbi:DUF4179 domain-containing protein [uncultured Agathobaculum sp.]|uniref:DUF4179 domain-containing protein n=1 Tax=uncultured Agathobaculum sp. TaxID=2048140 RepID=UPI0032098FB6